MGTIVKVFHRAKSMVPPATEDGTAAPPTHRRQRSVASARAAMVIDPSSGSVPNPQLFRMGSEQDTSYGGDHRDD